MILLVRTDSENAYIGFYEDQIVYEHSWHAHRNLSETLLKKIEEGLATTESEWDKLSAVIVFAGPGSFTGLRIGITVANTLANSQAIPIVGKQGEGWIEKGLEALADGQNDKIVSPEYGSEANITIPKK